MQKLTKYWLQIPRVFRISVIVSCALVCLSAIVGGVIKNPIFGVQTAIIGGFSVALLCAYVVWIGGVTAQVKSQEQGEDAKNAASAAVVKIQVASLVKLLLLSAFIVVAVVLFHFHVVAAIVGVAGIYAPLAIVPLFVKSEAPGLPRGVEASRDSEVKDP